MESERPHRTTSTNSSSTSELFICFTSRLSSSSSMKLSKSILSPGRTREQSQISLSSSLSRRLRSSGSMKGGQASPMFPTGGKKRGCAFENPEPSSPKVTCIGQVRVKTKKQGKKLRTRSKRRGEASFRGVEQQNATVVTHQELNIQNNANSQFQSHQILQQQQQQECLPHRNQRWVHLPVTICEALRAFGAEFNCFLPCRSSCMTSEREKEEKAARLDGGESGNGSSCGAVFARWLVAMQEGEGKGREIELVVEEEERVTDRSHSMRRDMFDGGFETKEQGNEVAEEEQEEARVSICIPPKNALLLMRCRSDPVKMAALANRFWESPVKKDEDEDEDEGQRDEGEDQRDVEMGEERPGKVEVETEVKGDEIREKRVSDGEEHGHLEERARFVMEEQDEGVEENPEVINELQEHPLEQEEDDDGEEEEEEDEDDEEEELELNLAVPAEETSLSSSPEALVDLENSETEQNMPKLVQEDEEVYQNEPESENEEEQEAEDDKGASFSPSSVVSAQSEQESEAQQERQDAKPGALAQEAESSKEEKETPDRPWEDGETATHERSEPEFPSTNEEDPDLESNILESQPKRERESSVLPDCLLLMMCEPKLSMEVSKETWVCSTDFIRCLPERPINKTNGGDEVKKRVSTENSNPTRPAQQQQQQQPLLQPPRSSCSFPIAAAAPAAGASMASMIEQKLVGSNGYEPFVLTRCKSEPMRSSVKFAPDACFWKNGKLEPHRQGVGAAGVGF